MYCKRCGMEHPDGTRFCSNCGTSMIERESNNAYAQNQQNQNQYQQNQYQYQQNQYQYQQNQYQQNQYQYHQDQYYYDQNPYGQYGQQPYGNGSQSSAGKGKGMAIASLILGIISLAVLAAIAVITGPLGIIFGCVSKNQGYRGGMATAGIVCGAIGLGCWLLIVMFAPELLFSW